MNSRLLFRILRNRSLLLAKNASSAKLYLSPSIVISRSCSRQKSLLELEQEKEEIRRKKLSEEEKLKEDLEQVHQMNEYYSQYVEEYYEEDEQQGDEQEETEEEKRTEKEEQKMRAAIKKNLRPVKDATPECVVELLRELRAKDIVCLKVPINQCTHPYMIICSSQNDRHADAVTQSIRKFLKLNFYYPDGRIPDKIKNSAGWFVLDVGSIVLHMMTNSVRELYDIEMLHGVGEDREDQMAGDEAEFLPPSAKKV